MKEELIQYVMEQANKCYADDFPISNIEVWIREFFEKEVPGLCKEKREEE